jgi:hypothetical protein
VSEALLVLNPRWIPGCIDAIRNLNLPTCWLSYMNEAYAADAANEVIRTTDYDRYLILSDDTLPTREALDLILNTADDGFPVVTGYCNLDEGEYQDIVNLTTNKLPPPPAGSDSYHFMTRSQAEQGHKTVIPTTFAGLALTLTSRDHWLNHPLQVEPTTGGQMDYDLCYRLAQTGIPIVAPVGAYVHHVKERWCHMDRNPEKRLLVGKRPPKVSWTQPVLA